MIVDDNGVQGLPQKAFLQRFSILDLGIKFQEIVFLPFLQNVVKDIPSFV